MKPQIPNYRIEGANLKCQLGDALYYARCILDSIGIEEVSIFRVRAGKSIRIIRGVKLIDCFTTRG